MARKIELNGMDNQFVGTGDAEWILGNGGDDTVFGRGGDDRLVGGEGDDRLSGGAGGDRLNGGAGTNIVNGGSGKDIITLDGTYAEAGINQDGDGWIITTALGRTAVKNVELFRFSDGTMTEEEILPPYWVDYFLSPGADNFIGGNTDDIFITMGTGSLNSVDVLDSRGGIDVLRIGPGGMDPGAVPTLLNIETIEDWDGSGLDLAKATGVERVTAYAAPASYINASLDTTFAAAAGSDQTISVDYAGTLTGAGDTAALATSLSAAATVDFDFGTDAAGIETVLLDIAAVEGGGVSTVELDADLGGLTGITVTGAGDATIRSEGATSLTSATLAVIDASAATGNIAAGLNGQADVTITLGAGDDTLAALGTEQGLSLTLGAGDDRLVLADLANIGNAGEAGFASDLITLTHFNAARDVIDLTAAAASWIALGGAQQSVVEDAASLFAAVTAAAGFTDADELVVFDYGGNAYVYLQDGDAGFDAGDGLIALGGVSAADLDTANLLV